MASKDHLVSKAVQVMTWSRLSQGPKVFPAQTVSEGKKATQEQWVMMAPMELLE